MEEAAAAEANTINPAACRILGVADSFMKEWAEGVVFEGREHADSYFLDDYPNLKDNAQLAALEFDRFTSLNKIFWYPEGQAPSDLCVCPANVIL